MVLLRQKRILCMKKAGKNTLVLQTQQSDLVWSEAEQDLLAATEMRMWRWMMEIKRIEKIRREEIRTRAGVSVWQT